MNQQFKYMLLLISTLALLVSACASPPLAEGQPASAQGVEPPTGAGTEVRSVSQDQFGDAGQGIAVESSQNAQAAAAAGDANQVVDPDDMPTLEERDAMLDGVNRGGLAFPESEQAPAGEGPAPGTESVLGPGGSQDDILERVNLGGPVLTESIQVDHADAAAPELADASQAVDPEDIPSLEERDAMLDGVNRGGLVFPESEQAPVGEGPAPGTESIVGAESVSNTTEEADFFHALNQFVETLRNWLQALID